MTEQINKAFFIKKTELEILLAIKGTKELFGFQLGTQGKMEQGQLNQHLFEMTRKEIVYAEKNKILINPEIELLVKQIIDAEKMLVLSEKAEKYPEWCIYVGKEAVSIQLCGQYDDIVRLEKIILSDLPNWIVSAGFRMEQILKDSTLYQQEQIECQELEELAENSFKKEKNEVLVQNGICACLLMFSMITQKKEQQILLCSKGMEDYITVSNGVVDDIYAYSERKLLYVICECIGGK